LKVIADTWDRLSYDHLQYSVIRLEIYCGPERERARRLYDVMRPADGVVRVGEDDVLALSPPGHRGPPLLPPFSRTRRPHHRADHHRDHRPTACSAVTELRATWPSRMLSTAAVYGLSATVTTPSCPAASANASCWPERWPRARSYWPWTNSPTTSKSGPASRSSTSSAPPASLPSPSCTTSTWSPPSATTLHEGGMPTGSYGSGRPPADARRARHRPVDAELARLTAVSRPAPHGKRRRRGRSLRPIYGSAHSGRRAWRTGRDCIGRR
jgi:hypothetical protein